MVSPIGINKGFGENFFYLTRAKVSTYDYASSMSVPYVGTLAAITQHLQRVPHHKVVGLTPRPHPLVAS